MPATAPLTPRPPLATRWTHWAILLIPVIALIRLCTADFVLWDDPYTVSRNPSIVSPSLQSVAGYWRVFPPPGEHEMRSVNHQYGLWAPFTYTIWSALGAVGQVTGADGNPEPNPYLFHTFNLALHCATAGGVMQLLRRFGCGQHASFWGALLFAVHPLQVEAVAWISGLKDLLAGALGVATLLAYLRHSDSVTSTRARVWWWTSVALYVLALLSKPSAVAIPVLLLLIDLLRPGRTWRQSFLAVGPLLAIAVPFVVIAAEAQPATGVTALAPWMRPLVAGDALAFYLRKLFVPIDLSIDYGRTPQAIVQAGTIWWSWIIPAGVATALGWAARRTRDPRPVLAAGIAVVCLLPMLGLKPFLFQFYSTVTDHYVYLAMLGPALLAAWMVDRLPSRFTAPVAGAIAVAMACVSFNQSGYWSDSRSLFEHGVSANPTGVAALGNLASVKAAAGEVESAIDLYQRAIAINPKNATTARGLREALVLRGDGPAAREAFRTELRVLLSLPRDVTRGFFDDPAGYGALLLLRDRRDDALRYLDGVLALNPRNGLALKLKDLAKLFPPAPPPATQPSH